MPQENVENPVVTLADHELKHYTMENKYTGLAELNQKTNKCIVKARVSRLWFPFNPLNRKQTFGIDMLLIDEKGDQIHAKVQDSLKDKFEEKVEEGKIYTFEKFEVDKEDKSYRLVRFNCKILFTKATIVTPTNEDDKIIENYKFTFVGFEKFLTTEDASPCDLKDIITILKKNGKKKPQGYKEITLVDERFEDPDKKIGIEETDDEEPISLEEKMSKDSTTIEELIRYGMEPTNQLPLDAKVTGLISNGEWNNILQGVTSDPQRITRVSHARSKESVLLVASDSLIDTQILTGIESFSKLSDSMYFEGERNQLYIKVNLKLL
ncbi:hypothetical protein IFM89_017503 [Coptis chinensis]|uniref:Replication protein A 70 kDa DNA-binding subunit B/D first OB fold domain-containing protein n=1 Tax=Coptis chinensis TaxID=261450 RepID=A0A835LW69_9MAGN|nr:hypothetical protein IFM89_017503 [Coptis chinensis]